jgi:FkbM family methyltransferase
MLRLYHRLKKGYRVRKIREWYDATFHAEAKEYVVRYNEITGPYKLVMRLADGPGMRQRLHDGTEMAQRRIFLPLLRSGYVCCDVGAHVGDYTVEMALLVGVRGRVVAYEAVPHYFGLLQKSLKANGLMNVETRLAVVGERPGKASIPWAMLTGSIARPGRVARMPHESIQGAVTAQVPVVQLDDELDRLDAIKVDCEGYEVLVLKGMRKLVNFNPRLVLFLEVHERQLKEVGNSLSELGALIFGDYRFKCHQIGYKHCICSQSDLPLSNGSRLSSVEEFVLHFRGT